MSQPLEKWERAEIARSAAEAASIKLESLVADAANLARYVNPGPGAVYPLEYAFHLVGDIRGLTVLDYGCGDGLNTILLTQRGARRIISLDISPELVAIARRRLTVNSRGAEVHFVVGSAHDMPLPDESVDLVLGIAILHHLDIRLARDEVRRVLRRGGRAIFQEPVRNSRLLKFARKLVPYRAADVSPYERPLTAAELDEFVDGYSSHRKKAFLLPSTRAVEVLPPLRRFAPTCYRFDSALLGRFPSLGYYATVHVIEVTK